MAGDLTGVRRTADALGSRASQHIPIRAAQAYARGEYHRLRGDPQAALAELTGALALMKAGEDMLWALAARAHVCTLIELGRAEEACTFAVQYWELSACLGYMRSYVRMAWAEALLARGEHAQAAALSDTTIEQLTAANIGGLTLATAYEQRAHVADASGDRVAFRKYMKLCEAQRGEHRRSRALDADSSTPQPSEMLREPSAYDASVCLRSTVDESPPVSERLRRALTLFGQQVQAQGGALWTRTDTGLVRVADFGEGHADAVLDAWAHDFFHREVVDYITQAEAISEPADSADLSQTEEPPYLPILLGHDEASGYVFTGLVVLLGGNSVQTGLVAGIATELSRIVAQLER